MQGHITGVGGGIWPKFELIQAFMHVLVTCKNEVDPIKNEGARVFTRFFHYTSMGIFPDAQGQLTPSPWSDLAKFRIRLRCYGCPHYLQVLRRSDQK